MEVKDFVKNMLKDVTEAVDESCNDKRAFDIPDGNTEGIDFDLAIVLKKGTEGKIGAEIFSSIGAKAEGSINHETVNRIKFKVNTYQKNTSYS